MSEDYRRRTRSELTKLRDKLRGRQLRSDDLILRHTYWHRVLNDNWKEIQNGVGTMPDNPLADVGRFVDDLMWLVECASNTPELANAWLLNHLERYVVEYSERLLDVRDNPTPGLINPEIFMDSDELEELLEEEEAA